MSAIPVIAIIDVGKTNKKILLFDERYKVRYEKSIHLDETVDEDGFSCEDINALTQWLKNSIAEVFALSDFNIKAINFSGYGASFVHLDEFGKVIAPLYNYLKPYPGNLLKKFYETYGGETKFSRTTASPVLGNLNSGMQLYRLKYELPEVFKKIKFSLHLPQYLSFLLTGQYYSDITSLGCHTNLWDFEKNNYHNWVGEEGVDKIMAPIASSDKMVFVNVGSKLIPVGIGLHDSSAALMPYQTIFQQPFNLLSTGTWCINLNPFNASLLTDDELKEDCLCYLSYEGKPVKASRIFAGYEHEQQTKRLAVHFHVNEDYYKSIRFNEDFLATGQQNGVISLEDLNLFPDYESAYYQLIEYYEATGAFNSTCFKEYQRETNFCRWWL